MVKGLLCFHRAWKNNNLFIFQNIFWFSINFSSLLLIYLFVSLFLVTRLRMLIHLREIWRYINAYNMPECVKYWNESSYCNIYQVKQITGETPYLFLILIKIWSCIIAHSLLITTSRRILQNRINLEPIT